MRALPVTDAGPAARREAERLDALALAATGHPALGDAVWRAFDRADPRAATFVTHAGDDRTDGAVVGLCHVAPADNAGEASWSLGLALAPGTDPDRAVPPLLGAARAHMARHGGGRATLWLLAPGDALDAAVRRGGARPDRVLYEMRGPLPLREVPRWPPGVRVRDFRPGDDDAAWLALNNRAFAGHAEQGGWTAETLHARTAEAWFDPSLFLVAEDDAGLVGFNWCKLHPATSADPVLGEIYVIGIDPRAQGTGLGRALAVAGLARLYEHGATTGMLFVAAGNDAAVGLYRSLGFTHHRTDRSYVVDAEDATA